MSGNKLTEEQKRRAEHWLGFSPPIRPSKSMIALYEKNISASIKDKANSVWGLLGCTPEIRSIAGKYQAEITCLDRDKDAFYAYKSICNTSQYEKFMCIDWLDMDISNMFDIVIGDGAMSMLPIENHVKFLTNIHQIVKPEGRVILKIHAIAPLIFDSPEKIFQWYRKEKSNTSIYLATKHFLYTLWLDPTTLRLDNIEFMAKVEKLYQKGVITDEEYEEMGRIKKSKILLQYTTKEIFEQSISGLFEIESVDFAGDYPLHTNHPLYLLRKK